MGGAMLWLAAITPWHADSDAYFVTVGALHQRNDFEAMSAAFHEAQDRFATPKWLYADVAYALLAWALVGGALCVAATKGGLGFLFRTCTRFLNIFLLVLLSTLLLALGALAGAAWHPLGRQQVPPWADSVAIPYASVAFLITFLAPLMLAFATLPLLWRPNDNQKILVATRSPHVLAMLVSLFYAAPIAFSVLLVLSAPSPGGWGVSVAGTLMLWLFLNARAMAIGSKGTQQQ
jgi:hypothetical protein